MEADSVHEKGEDTSPSLPEVPNFNAQEDASQDNEPTPEVSSSDEAQPSSSSAPEVAPVAQPIPVTPQPTPPTEAPHPQPSSAGVIVLQWLTYAFWGWLILGLIWVMSVILINAILGDSVNESVPYAIAASVVLLPLAYVCDLFYRKHEPTKKAGASMVIMVIHAVIFAILGIVSLIVAVFVGINALINIGEPLDSQMVGLLVALFAAILYAAAFMRTINPFKTKKPAFIYGTAMAILTVVLLIFAVVGPVIASLATRGDRLIETALPNVQTSVEDYITENEKLPASLDDLTLSDPDARSLVKDGKVEYKAVGKVSDTTFDDTFSTSETYRYQLCVTYVGVKNTDSARDYSYSGDDGYINYLSTYSHEAGLTCYKLQQTVY